MIRLSRNLARLWTIARCLARHDALFLLDKVGPAQPVVALLRLFRRRDPSLRPGQRLAQALQELGPTFIKLGQALSIRSDLVGEEVAADLSGLQDCLPPFPFEQARAIVEAELGAPLAQFYASFDEVPVAAASIAQVHFATTTDGREVAVKVLRPGVAESFERDIDLLYWIAEGVERMQPAFRRLKPVETVRTFEDSVQMEMDLRFEAAASAEMRDNFLEDEVFDIPEVDWTRTGQRVLTLERVNGIPVDELDKLRALGLEPREIVREAAVTFFNMVFRDGFFHADMHPGNLFVLPDGKLVAVDFGITGRIDQKTRRYLGEMLLGFLTGNYRRVAEVHFEAGYVPADQNMDNFTQACRSIAEPIFGKPIADISIARLLGQLFQVTETFNMAVQPQLLLLQKSMLVAEGVGRQLDPEINMWQLAQPLIEQWMRQNLGPEARIRGAVGGVMASLEHLPRLAERAAEAFTDKGVRLHPDTVRELARSQRRGGLLPQWLPWVLAAVLAGLLLAK